MSKPKSNSIIEALPANQRAQLTDWLFGENISYVEAQKRLLADFNLRCGQSALADFYQRTAQERLLEKIAVSQAGKNAVIDKFKANPADTYHVLLEMVGQIAFDKAMQADQQLDAETLFNFTKLVMTGKKQAMEAADLALRQQRFQFDAAKLVDAKFEEIAKARRAPGLNGTERIQAVMKVVFGEKPEPA